MPYDSKNESRGINKFKQKFSYLGFIVIIIRFGKLYNDGKIGKFVRSCLTLW